jgi:regulatory protein
MVDGRPFCSVPEDAAGEAGLEVGAAWNADKAVRTSQFADAAAVWQSLLTALARRAHSAEELRRRLTRKGHHPDLVGVAIRRALAERLLNDSVFAEQYVASRAARGRGPSRLRRDLRILGVADREIEGALASHWADDADPLDLARQLAQRRARQLAQLPPETRRRRVTAYLARRGFSGASGASIAREACANP